MIQIKKILFPTRFSHRSKWSIAYSLQLAKKYKAELHLLHAQVLWDDDPHNPAYHFSDKTELQTRLLNAAKDQMSTDLEKSDIQDIEVKQAFELGMTPSETILKYAAENNIDLIVMDAHRKQGVRLLLGSILDEVVRSAPCAVLAIHHKKNAEPKFALYSAQDFL